MEDWGARGAGLLTDRMACSFFLGLGLQLWITGYVGSVWEGLR